MALPDPKPGLVVRYDYLWSHEAAAGRGQGKSRATCLVAASDSLTKPRYVVLLPITHSPPDAGTIGIEIPAKVKRVIGLDDMPSCLSFQSTISTNGRTVACRRFRESRKCSAMVLFHQACSHRSKPGSSNWPGKTPATPCAVDGEEEARQKNLSSGVDQ